MSDSLPESQEWGVKERGAARLGFGLAFVGGGGVLCPAFEVGGVLCPGLCSYLGLCLLPMPPIQPPPIPPLPPLTVIEPLHHLSNAPKHPQPKADAA